MIIKCNCKHEGQDALHGKGMRLHNPGVRQGKDAIVKFRCTVCGDQKSKYQR